MSSPVPLISHRERNETKQMNKKSLFYAVPKTGSPPVSCSQLFAVAGTFTPTDASGRDWKQLILKCSESCDWTKN